MVNEYLALFSATPSALPPYSSLLNYNFWLKLILGAYIIIYMQGKQSIVVYYYFSLLLFVFPDVNNCLVFS